MKKKKQIKHKTSSWFFFKLHQLTSFTTKHYNRALYYEQIKFQPNVVTSSNPLILSQILLRLHLRLLKNHSQLRLQLKRNPQ